MIRFLVGPDKHVFNVHRDLLYGSLLDFGYGDCDCEPLRFQLQNVDAESFHWVVHYLYAGSLEPDFDFTKEEVAHLYKLAAQLQIHGLLRLIENRIKNSCVSARGLIDYAHLFYDATAPPEDFRQFFRKSFGTFMKQAKTDEFYGWGYAKPPTIKTSDLNPIASLGGALSADVTRALLDACIGRGEKVARENHKDEPVEKQDDHDDWHQPAPLKAKCAYVEDEDEVSQDSGNHSWHVAAPEGKHEVNISTYGHSTWDAQATGEATSVSEAPSSPPPASAGIYWTTKDNSCKIPNVSSGFTINPYRSVSCCS